LKKRLFSYSAESRKNWLLIYSAEPRKKRLFIYSAEPRKKTGSSAIQQSLENLRFPRSRCSSGVRNEYFVCKHTHTRSSTWLCFIRVYHIISLYKHVYICEQFL